MGSREEMLFTRVAELKEENAHLRGLLEEAATYIDAVRDDTYEIGGGDLLDRIRQALNREEGDTP